MSMYRACGLVIDSEVPLAECPRAVDATAVPDVVLRVGTIEREWGEPTRVPFLRRMPDGALHCGELDGPRFLVSRSTVIVDPDKSGWRSFFLGPVLGALCYLNDRLPLHASAVEIDGRAVAFAGPSGAGKSTLAAALVQRYGCRLISDEVSAVRLAPPAPVAFPYLSYHRLSSVSVACLDLNVAPATANGSSDDKTLVSARAVTSDAIRLDALYCLEPARNAASRDSVASLSRPFAAAQVMQNLYRGDIGEHCRPASALLAAVAALVEQVSVRLLSYDSAMPGLRGVAEAVLADLKRTPPATADRASQPAG